MAESRKRTLDDDSPNKRIKTELSDDYFGIFLVGECGDGKTAFTQYMADAETRKHLTSAAASRGVTKDVSYVNVRPEVMENAIIIDVPGVGDQDVKIDDLIAGVVHQMESIRVHAIVLMTSMSKQRAVLGAQAAGHFVKHGFVKSLKNVIYCGTQCDVYISQSVPIVDYDLDDPESKAEYLAEVEDSLKEWRTECADKITQEMFRNRHAETVTIQLHMKRAKKGKKEKIVVPDGKNTNVEELITVLKNLQREKITCADWETPDVGALFTDISACMGAPPPSKNEINQLTEQMDVMRGNMAESSRQSASIIQQLREDAKEARLMAIRSQEKADETSTQLREDAKESRERAERAQARCMEMASRPPQVIRGPPGPAGCCIS